METWWINNSINIEVYPYFIWANDDSSPTGVTL